LITSRQEMSRLEEEVSRLTESLSTQSDELHRDSLFWKDGSHTHLLNSANQKFENPGISPSQEHSRSRLNNIIETLLS
jgi:hypothetical protein